VKFLDCLSLLRRAALASPRPHAHSPRLRLHPRLRPSRHAPHVARPAGPFDRARPQEALPIVGAVVLVAAVASYLWKKKPWRKGDAPATA
jgi:hypothetical protein